MTKEFSYGLCGPNQGNATIWRSHLTQLFEIVMHFLYLAHAREEIMNTVLSPEQQKAIHANREIPLRVLDPDSNEPFVIVPAQLYEDLMRIRSKEFQLSDTYPAQAESAMRAGWNDPAMDEYENYDENYKKACKQNTTP